MSNAPRRTGPAPVGFILWCSVTALWLVGALVDRLLHSGPLSCELSEGSSVYGEPGWSWFPLGHTCMWADVGGRSFTDHPPLMTLAPPLILALWALSLAVSRGTPGSLPARSPFHGKHGSRP